MWIRAAIIALACAPVGAADYAESFDDQRLPCVSLLVEPGFAMQADGGRCAAAKEPDTGNGSAQAALDFDLSGDFSTSVHVSRGALGEYGTLGLLVLFDDGQFINIYFRGMGEISVVNSINGRSGYLSEPAPEAVFRLRRVGTTIHYEYDKGGGFLSLGADPVPSGTRPGRAHLFLTNYLNEPVAYSGSFDDWAAAADEFLGAACLCPPDMNGDGSLNVLDFLAFQTAYGNEDPSADFAPPFGTINLFDFLQFQTEFGNGC